MNLPEVMSPDKRIKLDEEPFDDRLVPAGRVRGHDESSLRQLDVSVRIGQGEIVVLGPLTRWWKQLRDGRRCGRRSPAPTLHRDDLSSQGRRDRKDPDWLFRPFEKADFSSIGPMVPLGHGFIADSSWP